MHHSLARLAVIPAALVFSAAFPLGVVHAEPANESSQTPKPDRAAATLADLAWLEGQWVGTGMGGHLAGETFSYAGDGQMVGHFWQLDKDGGVNFYEIITITPDGESLVMRLKHFTADLTGWEEKPGETALNFRLRERSDTRWRFGPVTFTRPAPDRLEVSVLMGREEDGTPRTLDFSYKKVRAD